ncbi:hypothetical protein LINPERHAP2_LOCUS10828 [Linum perenne]
MIDSGAIPRGSNGLDTSLATYSTAKTCANIKTLENHQIDPKWAKVTQMARDRAID